MKKIILMCLSFCLFLCMLLSGCNDYSGDGIYKDHGLLTAKDRYVIDLGDIDLSSAKKYKFTLSGLPAVEMVVGLQIEPILNDKKGDSIDRREYNSLVRLELRNTLGELSIKEMSQLKEWIWSHSNNGDMKYFIYRKGEYKNEEGERDPRANLLANKGWGTYFLPRKNGKYNLIFEVIEPINISHKAQIKMIVKGGGWK